MNMTRKRFSIVVLVAMVTIALAVLAWAQANQWSTITPSGAVAGCPPTSAGQNAQCSVTDGYYFSVGGGPYQKAMTSGTIVTTFNGRNGDVLPAANDYTFSQIGGLVLAGQLPSTFTCTVSMSITGAAQTATFSNCH